MEVQVYMDGNYNMNALYLALSVNQDALRCMSFEFT